jgi:hypothetical protein
MPKPLPERDHHIPPGEARRVVARRRSDDAKAKGAHRERPFGFHRKGIDRVLAQPGCVGVRIYPARHDDGSDTWVVVGVDGSGSDMTSGALLQIPITCPPDCDEKSAFLVE